MKLTITIPDELYEKYEGRFLATLTGEQAAEPASPGRAQAAVGKLLVHDAERAQTYVAPGWLHVSPEELGKLQALLAGSIPDGRVLVERVEGLSHITLGGIRLEFTAKQLEELERKAKRNGEDPKVFLQRVVKMMEGFFFSSGY